MRPVFSASNRNTMSFMRRRYCGSMRRTVRTEARCWPGDTPAESIVRRFVYIV